MKFKLLSDDQLVEGLRDNVISEQEGLAENLEYIAELDRRKLFYHYPSLRSYLTAEFGMAEAVAEHRIRAARLINRLPWVSGKIESGKLSITHLELALGCAFREKLGHEDLSLLLESLCGISTEAAKREIATRYPQTAPIVKDRVRELTGDLSEVRFVAPNDLLEKLDEIRGLLAHAHAHLSMADLIDVLVTDYRERHHPEEKARRAQERQEKKTEKMQGTPEEGAEPARDEDESLSEVTETVAAPRPRIEIDLKVEGRIPSAEILYAIIRRDGYQCRYDDPKTGKRCTSRFALQVDHIKAWHLGGETKLSNLRYLCRSHHRRVSFLQFGESCQYFGSRALPPFGFGMTSHHPLSAQGRA